jgi:BirA family biotin operon repressor/biotin-[acetyl-CoA-carboxylase] ligase
VSTRAEIVRALAEAAGGHVSGHDLAERLGISRNAIWKHIEALRERGYVIESAHATGYRLASAPQAFAPEAVEAHLDTEWLGRHLVCHDVTGSTNDDACALAREGAQEGTVVLADAQTAGRGRLGRDWVSKPYLNLYASLILRPTIAPAMAPQLSLVAGVAVARALEAEGVEAGIKWPNDVLIGGRKVCGVLTEIEAEADLVGFVVVGIGVNLNSELHDFPEDLHDKAISVRMAEDRVVDRMRFAAQLFGCFEQVYELWRKAGFEPLREEWQRRAVLMGKPIEVAGAGAGANVSGVCIGIDSDGALLLKGDDTEVRRVIAGDVTLVGGYDR